MSEVETGGGGAETVIVILVILAVLGLTVLIKATHTVPQSSAVIIERFGLYIRTLTPGLSFVAPFIDRVRSRVDLREQVVPFAPQPVITRDNVTVNIDTVIYCQVTDPRAAVYEVANYIQAIEQLTLTTLRNIIGGMDVLRVLASREQINALLRGVLDEATGKWGIRVNRVELMAIEPPAAFQDVLEKHAYAEYDRRAAALTAEPEPEPDTKPETKPASAPDTEAITAPEPEPAPTLPVTELRPSHQPLRQDDPRRIDRYQLTARLGQGGMGTVYLGRSPGERMVAVKVIQAELAADHSFRRRFSREIEAARRVGGFHTASVVAADPHSDPPWLVTEYIPGPSLHDVLKQHGALPVKTVTTLALGVAEALEGIHACGIIHRDLKPSNIILSDTGPRVIDFGIARALDGTAITRTNHVVGTQGFLAPEQLTGGSITFAADLYAFGMVLCHAAGAAPLTDGETLESALSLLPSRLQDAVTRCLSPDPGTRPTPTHILEELASDHPPIEDWLPPPIRTLIDLHNAPTLANGG